jgi:hypothetical protein
MSVQFYLEGDGELFALIERLDRIPEVDDIVYLYDVSYKVELIETYLEDDDVVNRLGGIAPWALSKELYKIYLSEVV